MNRTKPQRRLKHLSTQTADQKLNVRRCLKIINCTHLMAYALITLVFSLSALAQDTKKEYAPTLVDKGPEQAKRKINLGPAGPRINSTDALRRQKESRMRRQNLNVEQKLIRLIKNTPDTNRKKPLYLDRLASFYWKLAGDAQNDAYVNEEACFSKSARTNNDVDRCADNRVAGLRKAEEIREKAIGVYKYIVTKFDQFEELDRILFALGFNYQQKQQNEEAKTIYTELIQRYPDSRMLADALFNLADIYFASGDVPGASQLYSHVIDQFKDSPVYPYAVYKLGWCYYNTTDYQGALNQFIQVIDLQNALSARQKKKNRLSLKKEAQRDLIRVYVNIQRATASGGLKLLKRYAPERHDELAERLADLYSGTGQFAKSTIILRKLIAKNPNSYRVVGYQIRISENLANTHSPEEAIRSLKRLVTLWKSVKNAPDAKPKRVKADHKAIERQLNALARQYHNQALETKSVADFNTALELYETYVEAFPNEKNSYEMGFYYAELLFRLEKWDIAARAYEQVLAKDPQGQFTKDAAHGTLLAYKSLLKDELDNASIDQLNKSEEELRAEEKKKQKKRRRKGKRKGKKQKAEPKKPRFPKKQIPDAYNKYLEASVLYRKYVQASEYLMDIQYEEARVYYTFNHFDKAIPLFRDIAERHPEHRVAVYAANLLLECFNRTGDFDSLAAQVGTFVGLYPPSRDAEFARRLKTLNSELDFKKCSLIENQGENIKAARCFEKYARRFKDSGLADKAYFNAALSYDREKQMEKAIQARVALINNLPDSELRPKAFYQIAKNLQSLAIYSQASKAYESFAENYPNREETSEALRLAAQFRLGLGELDMATKNLKKYINKLSKKEIKQAMVAFFELGSVLQERKQWSKMIKHYQSFTRRFKRVDKGYLIRAYTLTGNAYVNQPKRYRDHRRARGAYKEAVKVYKSIAKKSRNDLPLEARSAAAEALFKLATYEFNEVKKIQFTKVRKTKNVKRHVKMVQKNVKNLNKKMAKVKKNYEEVLSLNVESWGLAALSQIGQMFYFFFTTLEKTPPPRIFDYEMQEYFRAAMIQQADPLRRKAIEAYKTCLDKSLKVQWFNEWTDLAEQQIAKINPEEYRYSVEERGSPFNFHQQKLRRSLVTSLPEEEEE